MPGFEQIEVRHGLENSHLPGLLQAVEEKAGSGIPASSTFALHPWRS